MKNVFILLLWNEKFAHYEIKNHEEAHKIGCKKRYHQLTC